LVDSGAMVNVLPYDLGLQLGLDWNAIPGAIPLAGNLARHPAKGVVISASVANQRTVQLAFAWSPSPDARLILEQVNFFMEFDICFFRSRAEFDVQL
jgi:hypothetical protein